MMFQEADQLSLSAFVFLIGCMWALIVTTLRRVGAPRKYVLGIVLFLALFIVWVMSGALEKQILPLVPLLLATVFAGTAWLAYSPVGQRIGDFYSFAALLGFQSFRLPLEIILHRWAEVGTVPPTMTWSGQNWDVITGILSLIAIPFLNRSRALVWGVQIIGTMLLMNVLRVVAMSSPFPFSWPLEQPLQLIFHLPYALIVPLCVAPALFGHLIVFRKLLKKR